MGKKVLNIEKVRLFFQNFGHKLITDFYQNEKQILNFQCKCGNLHHFRMMNMEKTKPQCRICQRHEQKGDALSYEVISEIFSETGFKVLDSKEEYDNKIGMKRTVKIICERAGHITDRDVQTVKRRYKCQKCCANDNVTGENCIWYKHGKSEENMTDRQKNNNLSVKWKRAVLKLKGKQCDICKSEEDIHAHHLNGYDWFIEGRFDPNNGIPVCENHHWGFHNKYGRGGNTSIQYDKYKEKTLRLIKIEECYQFAKEFLP